MGLLCRRLLLLLLLLLLQAAPLVPAAAAGSATANLQRLEQDYFRWRLEDAPEFAADKGFHQYDGDVEDFSLDVLESRRAMVEHFLARALTISEAGLTDSDRYNLQVLLDSLRTMVRGYTWRHYGNLNPINFLEGIQTNPETEPGSNKFQTVKDFENYVSRLEKRPLQLEQFKMRMQKAVDLGRTMHRVSIEPVLDQIQKLLVTRVEDSPFYAPFLKKLDELAASDAIKQELRNRGKLVVMSYLQAYQRLRLYIRDEYLHHTRGSYGVGGWNQGALYYRKCLEWHLTTNLDPEYVFQRGSAEVHRISSSLSQIMKRQNFNGTLAEFFVSLRKDPRFHINSSDELLQRYQKIINRVYPLLPRLFKNVPPRRPKVKAMSYDGPGGEYSAGTRDGSRPGTFYVNLMRPNDTNLFSMKALTLHETVPGHHLQEEYAQASSLPDFRRFVRTEKYYAVPYNYPFYTAYVEGWALYAESLGEEMGVYDDDFDYVGRYGEEILRACRLVVDSGLHYRGWSRQQAIDYMAKHLPAPLSEIEIEVDRYITWPGQACAYKIGELKIRELRDNAKAALGSRFDLREFHYVLLKDGPVPLGVLETMVADWVAGLGGDPALVSPDAVYSSLVIG